MSASPAMRWRTATMLESETPATDLEDLQSLAELRQFERLLSELSAGFIDLPAARIDDAIVDGLRRIVETLGIDRSTLSSVDPNTGQFHALHSYAAPGLAPVPATLSSRSFPWVLATMRAGRPIVFSSLDEMPPEATLDRSSYASIGLRSHAAVPVMVSGELLAVLGFGAIRKERAWSDGLIVRCRLLADLFASALARKRAQAVIDHALGFERLLADVSASLVGADETELDANIVAALRDVARYLSVDRVTLWAVNQERAELVATHRWAMEDLAPPFDRLGMADLPWALERILSGNFVGFTSLDELPPAAETDALALRSAGVRSLLAVALRTQDRVIGALSLSCVRGERIWPEELVPRLRLFGKMLLTALAHDRAERNKRLAIEEVSQFRERVAHLARVHTVGAMSAAIAHEVNQPLMAIENYAMAGRRRIAGEEPIDHAKLDALLEKIGDQAALAGEVLERLRSLVKRSNSEPSDVDVAQLIRATTKLIEMASELNDVRIETAIESDLPKVFVDDVQIQQVILNLAHNAMDAMAVTRVEDKVVRLEASATSDDMIAVRVIDRGSGIAEVQAETVFEPFYTTKASGLGIGLAICRAIIEAHGGTLSHSPNTPAGTIFRFTLPVDREEA